MQAFLTFTRHSSLSTTLRIDFGSFKQFITRPALGWQRSMASKTEVEPKLDYCDVPQKTDKDGRIIWPAPPPSMQAAREFIRKCARSNAKTLIVPDKDADGLSAGVIIHRTLVHLGLSLDLIEVHLIAKHASVHDESEREAMLAKKPANVIVVDQGSRAAPSIVADPNVPSLVIDHHLSDDFPTNAEVVSACHYPPVATSSLLTFEICQELHGEIPESCAFLCAMGTHGDLGNTLQWKAPFPDMKAMFKKHTKKAVTDAVALINAPRRTAKFDVISAWKALLEADGPKAVLANPRLLQARREINEEVELKTHAAPKFSRDGKIAVLRIDSMAQIHGVIATRWAGHLKSSKLEIVMTANSGYKPGYVNFSCRIARCARNVNIIESLKAAAALDEGDLVQRLGHSFARGHKEASGGIVPAPEFEELMALMGVGEKAPGTSTGPSPRKKTKTDDQKNNLMNYFSKKPSGPPD